MSARPTIMPRSMRHSMRRLGVVSSGNKLGQSITLLSDKRHAAEHETRPGTARPERRENSGPQQTRTRSLRRALDFLKVCEQSPRIKVQIASIKPRAVQVASPGPGSRGEVTQSTPTPPPPR